MIPDFYYWWVPMMAAAAPASSGGDDNVSLGALGAFVSVVLAAVAAFIAKKKGKAEGAEEEKKRHVSIADQPLGVKLEEELVTRIELQSHIQRIEGDISDIKEALEGERGIARTANGNVHKRIDAMSERLGERLSRLEGQTAGIADTTKTLLDIALGKKPGGTR